MTVDAGAAWARHGVGPGRSFTWLVVRFLTYLFMASLAFSIGGVHTQLEPLQAAIARSAAAGARLAGHSVDVSGSIIAVGDAVALDINHECTGVFVLIIYSAFLLAYPAAWLLRLAGIAVGIVVLEVVNVARLSVLTIIAARWPMLFDYFHEYLWQGVFVAILALLVASWIEYVNRQTVVSR